MEDPVCQGTEGQWVPALLFLAMRPWASYCTSLSLFPYLQTGLLGITSCLCMQNTASCHFFPALFSQEPLSSSNILYNLLIVCHPSKTLSA